MEISQRDIHQIEQFSAIGLTQAEIASLLEISKPTIERWMRDPVVHAAFTKGRANGIAVAGKKLWDKVQAGDLGAIIWFEKTRGRRSDRVHVINEDDATAIQRRISSLSDDELRRIADGQSPSEVLGE